MTPTTLKDGRYQIKIPRKMSPTGKRESKYFPSRRAAEQFIRDFKAEHAEHGRQAVTAEERRWLGYWKERVGELSLMPEIVGYWKRTGEQLQPTTVQDAVGSYLTLADADYSNRRTLNDVKERLRHFQAHFGPRPLHEISATDIETFLATFTAGWHRWSVHKRLKPFYRLAKRRKWIATDPMAELPTPKTPTPERHIYNPEQFQALLWTAEREYPALLPYVVLSGFCFLRTTELVSMYANESTLQWSDVLWADSLIHVRHGVAKGTRREAGDERYTPLTDTAKRWLLPFQAATGACVPMGAKKFGLQWRALTDRAKVERIDNGLRHSAISYSLAAYPEHGLALTAQWCGNSERTIRRHYRRLLKPEQGRAWLGVKQWAKEAERLQAKIRELQPAEPPEWELEPFPAEVAAPPTEDERLW
jgi:site-specific recombinase XerD